MSEAIRPPSNNVAGLDPTRFHGSKPSDSTLHIEALRNAEGLPLLVDEHLMSEHGKEAIAVILSNIERSQDIAKVLEHMIETTTNDSTLALLMSNVGQQGLNRPELAEVFSHNAAHLKLIRFIKLAEHDGAIQLRTLYIRILAILRNIVRYEALNAVHDPKSKLWEQIHDGLVYREHKAEVMFLPNRFNPQS